MINYNFLKNCVYWNFIGQSFGKPLNTKKKINRVKILKRASFRNEINSIIENLHN